MGDIRLQAQACKWDSCGRRPIWGARHKYPHQILRTLLHSSKSIELQNNFVLGHCSVARTFSLSLLHTSPVYQAVDPPPPRPPKQHPNKQWHGQATSNDIRLIASPMTKSCKNTSCLPSLDLISLHTLQHDTAPRL